MLVVGAGEAPQRAVQRRTHRTGGKENRQVSDCRSAKRAVDEIVAREGVVAAGNRCKVAGILYTYCCTIACGLSL
jgi:hypothetical protein